MPCPPTDGPCDGLGQVRLNQPLQRRSFVGAGYAVGVEPSISDVWINRVRNAYRDYLATKGQA